MAINKNFIVDAGIELSTTLTTGNSTVKSTVNSTVFTGTSNNSVYLDGQLSSYYTNATNIASGTLSINRLPDSTNVVAGAYGSASAVPVITVDSKGRVTGAVSTNITTANSIARGVLFVVDSVSNTDALSAASANSVRTTYTYATTIAGTAYSNAVAFSSNATNLSSGTVNAARLGTGTANSSTYLRGDGVWSIAGITLASNNTSVSTFYLPMSASATGSWTSGVVSDTALSFIPSTGSLRSTAFTGNTVSANSITVNAITISTVSANVNVSNNFLVSPALRAYSEFISTNATTTGATSLDLSSSNFFNLTLTGNTTFSFTNAPSGRMFSFTIVARQDATGGRTITWPAGSRYAGGLVPPATTTANAIDIWSAMTYDGGSTYIISLSVKDAK